ncbi:hypothetical protein [Bacillus sp. AK128]
MMSDNTKDREQHRFDQLMFGARRVPTPQKEDKINDEPVQDIDKTPDSTSTQGEFDLFQMLQSVDELMGNVKQFKPMVQQLAPLLDLFKQKK